MGPVSLPHFDILHAFRFLCFSEKRREDPLEGPDGDVKDLALSFGTSLHHCDHVIHITVYEGEAVHNVRQTWPFLGYLDNGTVTAYHE